MEVGAERDEHVGIRRRRRSPARRAAGSIDRTVCLRTPRPTVRRPRSGARRGRRSPANITSSLEKPKTKPSALSTRVTSTSAPKRVVRGPGQLQSTEAGPRMRTHGGTVLGSAARCSSNAESSGLGSGTSRVDQSGQPGRSNSQVEAGRVGRADRQSGPKPGGSLRRRRARPSTVSAVEADPVVDRGPARFPRGRGAGDRARSRPRTGWYGLGVGRRGPAAGTSAHGHDARRPFGHVSCTAW